MARRGNTVDWAIDGIRLATITNATFTASNVFVGYWDMFTSLSDNTNLSFGVGGQRARGGAGRARRPSPGSRRIRLLLRGANATLTVTANGTAPLSYQWRFNGTNLVSASASAYTVTNAQPANAGSYTVVVTNSAGSVTSAVARVVITNPPPAQPGHFDSICRRPDGAVEFSMSGTEGSSYVVEWTSDLVGWTNLCTLSGTNGLFLWADPFATNGGQRFYRLRVGP